jgi:hypothetical protein
VARRERGCAAIVVLSTSRRDSPSASVRWTNTPVASGRSAGAGEVSAPVVLVKATALGLVATAVLRFSSVTAVSRPRSRPSSETICLRMRSSSAVAPAGPGATPRTLATASDTSSEVATMLDSYDSSVRARRMMAARAGRAVGSRARHWARMSSSAAGRPSRRADALGSGMSWMLRMMSSASSPGNSLSPVNSSNMTAAAENRSDRVSRFSPRVCSGDM